MEVKAGDGGDGDGGGGGGGGQCWCRPPQWLHQVYYFVGPLNGCQVCDLLVEEGEGKEGMKEEGKDLK